MRILIDIGHPAHVHYFRNFIKIMEKKGHSFLIIAKNRNITFKLLKFYDIPFIKRKDYPSSILGKLWNIPITDLFVIKKARIFNPDIFMGFSGTHIAHAGKVLGIPSIVLDDTEHAKLAHLSYKSFATTILTPNCFRKDFGEKHIRFDSYMELCYLHKNYFTPENSILKILGIKENERYAILRFVSWGASHDVGHTGITLENKIRAVKEISKYSKVFISSEKKLPSELKQYQIEIPPERMHDALFFASLLFGESATMASECAALGTPAIFIDNNGRGYTNEEEEKYNLVFNFTESLDNQVKAMEKAIEILKIDNLKNQWNIRRDVMLKEKIDITALMVWFIEEYPRSVKIMKEKPDYQYNFR
ncbi:DUF354 domain-containing protein [Flavobacteriaceae bacterium PRS1]|nr:DUF354 domain-containing protein [Flavobacteriaceae bacterium PRS1]